MNTEKITNPQVISIVKTMLERCQKENEQNRLQVCLENLEERVTYYTGLPKAAVASINRENTTNDDNITFDVPQRILIMTALKRLYETHKYANFSILHEELNNLIRINYHNFQKQMLLMEFKYLPLMNKDQRTIKEALLLVECCEKRFYRFNFLNQIKKHRSRNAHIYYIDERIIDNSLTYAKPSQEFETHVDQVVFLHMVSSEGLDNYLLCNTITKEFFKKWVFEVLLKVLKPGSVIIMDNNILHGEPINNTFVTKYSKKIDMLNFLRNNNVPCSDDMLKMELYNLIKKSSLNVCKSYEIDRLLSAHGHQVLRLPFMCQMLSITELIWDSIKSGTKPLKINDMGEFYVRKIQLLCKSKWNEFESTVKDWEEKLFNLDLEIETSLDNYSLDIEKIEANVYH